MTVTRNVDISIYSIPGPSSLNLHIIRLLALLQILSWTATCQEFQFEYVDYNISMTEAIDYLSATIVSPPYSRLGVKWTYNAHDKITYSAKPFNQWTNQDSSLPSFTVDAIVVGDFTFAEIHTVTRLNRELADNYDLILVAELNEGSGGMRRATAKLHLTILDKNDGHPYFERQKYTASIQSNMPLFTPVVVVKARDADIGINAIIYYETSDENFSVDSRTGQVRLMTNNLLPNVYEFSVRAYNAVPSMARGSSIITTSVLVTVTEYNSKPPKFSVTKHNLITENGAAVDYSDGFVGCMRAMIINGVIQDLRGRVKEKNLYGIGEGCTPKCTNNPCMHEGVCIEYFSHYTCDCAYTPYRGWDCGREVGVNMMPAYMIKYEFEQSSGKIATDQEDITIGFVTKRKQGILMYITDGEPKRAKATEGDNKEYILVAINQNGGIKVALDVGFERQELNTENRIDFANGQQHVVRVQRFDRGHILSLQVDDYPAQTLNFSVSSSSDTKLDSPRYMYFGYYGYGDYKDNGFEGCLFRAQFDNIYPFKSVFQDPKPDENIVITGVDGEIKENMCAFPEVTNKPDAPEYRPTTQMPSGTTTTQRDPDVVWGSDGIENTDSFIIGGIVAGLFFLMALALFVVCRYYFRRKGAYNTNEAKSAKGALSADKAVTATPKHGLGSGPPAVKKEKEYYI